MQLNHSNPFRQGLHYGFLGFLLVQFLFIPQYGFGIDFPTLVVQMVVLLILFALNYFAVNRYQRPPETPITLSLILKIVMVATGVIYILYNIETGIYDAFFEEDGLHWAHIVLLLLSAFGAGLYGLVISLILWGLNAIKTKL